MYYLAKHRTNGLYLQSYQIGEYLEPRYTSRVEHALRFTPQQLCDPALDCIDREFSFIPESEFHTREFLAAFFVLCQAHDMRLDEAGALKHGFYSQVQHAHSLKQWLPRDRDRVIEVFERLTREFGFSIVHRVLPAGVSYEARMYGASARDVETRVYGLLTRMQQTGCKTWRYSVSSEDNQIVLRVDVDRNE